MPNKFEIRVVALDGATAVFRKVNNEMSKVMRPVTTAQRQFVALSREMHLDKIAKGMANLSHASMKVASSLGLATEPMEALFGLGAAGGIVAAGAAVVALGARWGAAGFEISRTAQAIGVSTDVLQQYRGAAKLAGLEQDDLTSSFANLGKTIQDASAGRNPEAFNILNSLGIGIKRLKDGKVDVEGTFNALADGIRRTDNPQVQALIASAFGVDKMLPLLRQGPEAIAKLTAEAQRLHIVIGKDGVEDANKFTEALDQMKGAAEGLANTWGAKITPLLTAQLNRGNAGFQGGLGSSIAAAWQNMTQTLFGGPSAIMSLFGGGPAGARSASGTVTDAPGALPIGLRQNNPGNLRSWGGAGNANGFAQFASSQDGLNAMAQQIGLYANRDGLKTIAGIVSKYAPPGDHNDTGAYIADVSRQTGFDPNAKLDINDPKVLAPLLSAMVKHEQGQQPFSNDQVTAAAQTVNVHVAVANAPVGTRVSTNGDTNGAIKVSYSLPMGDTP